MSKSPNFYDRKSTRLQGYDYSREGAYFITICTNNHEEYFGEIVNAKMILSESGKIADRNWIELPGNFSNIELDEYVVMPNHMHGIIIITHKIHNNLISNNSRITSSNYDDEWVLMKKPELVLGKIIRRYKAKVTNVIREKGVQFKWQRNYHDHIIRDYKELVAIRKYIINNPANWKNDEHNPANL